MLLHRFPVEYQMDSQDCGPASLKIIAKHFGKFYSLQFMRDRWGRKYRAANACHKMYH